MCRLTLQSLFKKCIENQYTGSKQTEGLMAEYEKLIWTKLTSIYKNTDGSYNFLLMELVINIYSEVNTFRIYIDLWNKIMNENYLKKIPYDKLEKDLIYDLHLKLYHNYNFSKINESYNFHDYRNNDLTNYSTYTYHYLFTENNIEFTSSQRNKLITNLYDDIRYILDKNVILMEDVDNETFKIRNQYILFWEAIKYMVEMYRYHEVTCLQRIYNTINDFDYNELKNLYKMSLIVYSFYVLKGTKGERRNDVIKIIESNSDIIQEIIDNNEVDVEEIQKVINVLHYGQVSFEGTLIDIRDIIYDFYVFILLLNNDPENTYKILKELFSETNPYWLYERYFNRVEETLENYGVFLKYYFWYSFTQETAIERLGDLKLIIERICKEYEFDKNNKLVINFEEYKVRCIDMFSIVIEPLNLRFKNIRFNNDEIFNYNGQFNKVINLRNMDSSISRVINNELTSYIFEVLKDILEKKELCKIVQTNLRQNRIKDFMSVLGERAENYDTIIGPNITGYGEYKEKFRNYLKGREFIGVPRISYLVALDSKRLFIDISMQNIEFLNLEWNEIPNKEVGDYEGEWTYQTINNIRLNFNKDELQEFADGIFRKLHIEFTIQIIGISSIDECGIKF